jgi:hypothetical protein
MKRRDKQKEILRNLLENKPEAKLVKNRYRAMKYVLSHYFPQLFEIYPPETIEELLKDVVYLDRQVRLATEGEDEMQKKILCQEYQMKELDREPNYHENVKKLATVAR